MMARYHLHALIVLVVALNLIASGCHGAGRHPSLEERLGKVEEENAELRSLVERLTRDIATLKDPTGPAEEEFELPSIDELLDVEPAAPQSSGATGQPSGDPALNPLMSFTFDYVANAGDRQPPLYDADGRSRNRALGLRALEMNAQRGVSAYADAFVTYGDHGHGFELEEGYIDINRWFPKMNVRLGKWRTAFGPYNGVHEHQMPFVTYPRTVTNFFSFHGCTGEGAELSYILPTSDYLQLRAGTYQKLGAGTPVFAADQSSAYSVSGRARYNKELGDDTDVDLAVSYLNGPNDDGIGTRTSMWNAAFQWRKINGTQDSHRLILDWTGMERQTALGEADRDAWSATYFRQAGLYHDWGLMYEDGEFGDPGIAGRARACNVFGTYKAQETQWFRLQLRHSEYPTGPNTDELMFQSIWSMGSHSHEFQ